ncbi:MAG: ARPP-1 family domain-containing protein [Candidatus Brocadiia bacterium]
MTSKREVWAALMVIFLLTVMARASYLTSDYEETEKEKPPPERVIPPRPANPLVELVRRVDVRAPYHYRGLSVYLLELSSPTDRTSYLSTQEAITRGLLKVREKGNGAVPQLVVENAGDRKILMISGELLLGGKQNRVLGQDVLLPPHSGPVEVPVRCIEQGRWSRARGNFKARQSVAPPAVRGAAQAGRSQGEVWEGVKRYQKQLEVDSGTRDLQAVHDSPEIKKDLKKYRDHVSRHCWRPSAVGMVVARYGRVLGADIFCNSKVFSKHRNRLLESYALDCIAYRRNHSGERWHRPSKSLAEKFLQRVYTGEFSWEPGAGDGRLLSVTGRRITGKALISGDRALHAGLFPRSLVIIRPEPPHPRPLPPTPVPVPHRERGDQE